MPLRSALTLLLAMVVGLAASGPALAQDDGAREAAEAVSVEFGAAGVDRWRLATDPPQTARLRAPALRGPGPFWLRWGVDLRAGTDDAVQPFVGVGLAAGPRTTLFYEQDHPGAATGWPPQPSPDAAARTGFEFRTRSPSAAWREYGTLRMQFGPHSRLSLKPRRDGVKVTWQTRF